MVCGKACNLMECQVLLFLSNLPPPLFPSDYLHVVAFLHATPRAIGIRSVVIGTHGRGVYRVLQNFLRKRLFCRVLIKRLCQRISCSQVRIRMAHIPGVRRE